MKKKKKMRKQAKTYKCHQKQQIAELDSLQIKELSDTDYIKSLIY